MALPKLMKAIDFASAIEKNASVLYVQAYNYRKLHNKNPSWYIYDTKMIVTDLYLKKLQLPARVAEYANGKLYWMMRATNHSNRAIAELLAKR